MPSANAHQVTLPQAAQDHMSQTAQDNVPANVQQVHVFDLRGGSVALNSSVREDKWSPAGFRLLRLAAAG